MDYNSLRVAELRDELRKRGLETGGVKAQLVARLEADDGAGGGGGGGAAPAAADEAPAPSTSTRGKRKKKEEEEEEEAAPAAAPGKNKRTLSQAIADLKEEGNKKQKLNVLRKVDDYCGVSGGEVHEDYDCMLNQTNINQNNNKFYVIQVIKSGKNFYCYNRWGRVGEKGQDSTKNFSSSEDAAIKDFKAKFKAKTGNNWEDRANFEAVSGKYTLIEMDHEAEAELAAKMAKLEEKEPQKGAAAAPNIAPCTLPAATQDLMRLIFSNDMFKEAMESFEIDVKKMPLGAISKSQIAKGYEALLEIDEAIKTKKSGAELARLTSRFYTLIPHSFGRRVPPVINNAETVQKKMDMLNVLGDIEIAQSLQENQKEAPKPAGGEVEHPITKNYRTLNADLTPVDKNDKMFKVIQTYLKETMGGYRKLELLDAFDLDRHSEGKRFDAHKDLGNRKLLWHGTNVAVVAAILATGLRIMPHSGGRVGKGIYLASENSKSANYVGCAGNIGIMFLAEAALGKEHHITRDDSSLTNPPPGFDSIVAKGHTEPDPTKDIVVQLDGNDVTVPQGKAIPQPQYKNSSFTQSEYLVYKESQVRLRYLLKLKFA